MSKNNTIDVRNVVVRFSGDSGDGMQLIGNMLANVAALTGNQIATYPDYPSEIRAPEGTIYGVSGYQLNLGANIYSSGETPNVLVAMNPAALKADAHMLTKDTIVIIDSDTFTKREYDKAKYLTEDPFKELGIEFVKRLSIPITSLTVQSLEGQDISESNKKRSKNIFTLGLICWLFGKSLDYVNELLSSRFGKRPEVLQANLTALAAGYNYGENLQLEVPTYKIDTVEERKGTYIDVTGNMATAYGFVAASEKSGRPLFQGSYPITPATAILEELSKLKFLGVKTVQAEDEIAGICTAIGASYAGNLAVTTTSGPGMALKSEAMGLAVMAELPLVIVDVQRGGPSTGMPTKAEQTDLMQALYGRSGESPLVIMATSTPTNCFDMAFWAAKIAMEHVTPVLLLSDAYVANGSSAWRIPDESEYPEIDPHDSSKYTGDDWSLNKRNAETFARYWAKAGDSGFAHRNGGLEKDIQAGGISSNPENHQKMVAIRQQKVNAVANYIPELQIHGDADSEILIVGWGGTYGHLTEVVEHFRESGEKVAHAHFNFISPLPKNTEEELRRYKKIIVAEQNSGMFANYLKGKFDNLPIVKYNRIEGRPLLVSELIKAVAAELKEL